MYHRWINLLGKFVYRGKTDTPAKSENDFTVSDKHTPYTVYIRVGKTPIPVYHAKNSRQQRQFKATNPNQRYV